VSLTAPERETVIVMSDADELARVYTAQRPVITRLKKNRAARLLEEGRFEGSQWARFELPKSFVSFRSKQRVLSDEERQRRSAALQASLGKVAALDSVDSDRRSSAAGQEDAA
jgi:hypothetical protein